MSSRPDDAALMLRGLQDDGPPAGAGKRFGAGDRASGSRGGPRGARGCSARCCRDHGARRVAAAIAPGGCGLFSFVLKGRHLGVRATRLIDALRPVRHRLFVGRGCGEPRDAGGSRPRSARPAPGRCRGWTARTSSACGSPSGWRTPPILSPIWTVRWRCGARRHGGEATPSASTGRKYAAP